jgi:hypothetical protein
MPPFDDPMAPYIGRCVKVNWTTSLSDGCWLPTDTKQRERF